MKPQDELDPASAQTPSALGVVKGGAATNGTLTLSAPLRAPAPVVRAHRSQQWLQLAAAAGRHWSWILIATALGVAVGAGVGRKLWSTTYTSTAQLVRYDTPDPELFQPRPVNPATLVGMVNSPEVRARVGARLTPAISGDEVARRVRVMPVMTTELVNIQVTAPDAATATAEANLYAEEAVNFTKEMQARDAREAATYLRHSLENTDRELDAANKRFQAIGDAPATTNGRPVASQLATRLEEARLELADLQSRYTDLHPLVQMQQARVAALEKQVHPAAAPAVTGDAKADAATAPVGDVEMLRDRARSLEVQHRTTSNRLEITELLAQNPPGHFKMFSPAETIRAEQNKPGLKIALFAAFLGLCGFCLGVVGGMTDEAMDRRLRTPEDVRHVTQLPVIARLGPIGKMSMEQRASWAFRTWTALQSRMSMTPNHGLVCGITASSSGEGRSTWIRMLADAANKCGFRVVVLTTRPGDPASDPARRTEARPAPAEAASATRFRTSRGEVKAAEPVLVEETTLSDALLGDPEQAANQIFTDEGTSVVHIPLPGWVWDLDHRKEWLASINAWGSQENVVVLVELPPASTPEAVLLAQNLPNVVWLAEAGKADALETRHQLETLRLAKVHLVGAVMNRSNGTPIEERFARWVPAPAMAALAVGFLLLGLPATGHAQDESVPSPANFSVVSPAQRAAWQKELTLGPGDVLRVALYGDLTNTRSEVTVQPDGRVSFLEARDVVAAGLTIDQLRAELDRHLGDYHRSARTMITPVAFRSKKYHMLGLVSQRGAFTLDRPMTVIEAVARARGFETSAASGDVTELADLQHAFLIRNGQRQPVDFARLFNNGDLSQNIAVEPGDYFYFPPADLREVYVLGEVAHPGPATVNAESTTLRAVATRGGFTDRAWRGKVLVIRGSLADPKPMVINLADVLAGKVPDLPLEPHDIVYVSARPWWKAEDLLDEAARAFTQAFVVYWTSDKVIPVVPLQ
jgi:protein involved in polysaccharide export with SLBB domain/capsular polysaccharide biosynthesis protein